MLILTNCLIKNADEGCVNVAYNLIKRIKTAVSDVKVVSYERTSKLTDVEMKLNKLMLSIPLFKLLRKEENVLYIPFPTRMLPASLRIWILSLFCKKLNVLISMHDSIDKLSGLLLKRSKAKLFVLSESAYKDFEHFVGSRVVHIKTGVDTEKFVPVTTEKSDELKIKYGFSPDKPVILHVGHLNEGRNIGELLNINDDYQILLVTSTLTKNEQNTELKNRLQSKQNIKIIDYYIPHIQEIYQLADLYFFPVVKEGNCIDIPLSCMEAAACNLPVVTTSYGAMSEFKGKKCFYHIDSFENINEIIKIALSANEASSRESVLEYDWNNAIEVLSR